MVKLIFIKTLNPSWKNAGITKIDLENESSEEKTFSELDIEYDPEAYKDTRIKVKQFSDLNSIGCGDMVKSSKIDGRFTALKAKNFSFNSEVVLVNEQPIEEQQKEFSVTTVKERTRVGRMSARQQFRYLIIDYKNAVRQSGGVEKIDPDTLKVMKSLFTSDLLNIMKTITPDIMAGKNPGTLLGASSLGKNVRVSVQQLFLPFRMGLQEVTKTGAISKNRYQKLQQAYVDFTNAMIEEVFGQKGINPSEPAGAEKVEETKK